MQLQHLFFGRPSRFSSTGLVALCLLLIGCSKESQRESGLKRADDYFQAGNFDAAHIEYKNVLQGDPRNVRAIAGMGSIWMEEGAPLRAAPFLLHIRDKTPDDVDSRMKLALAFRALGESEEARREASAVLALAPANEQALLLLGETARNQEEIQELRGRLNTLAAEDPPPVGYHLGSAFLAIRSSDFTAAEDHLRKALAVNPESFRAHLAIANIREIQGNTEAAEQELKRAADLSPVRSHARVRLADFYLRHGSHDKARTVLNEIKTKAPGFLPASNFLARLALAEGDFAQAIRQAEDALGRDDTNYDARLLKAQALFAGGDAAKATDLLERLDTDFPGLPFTKFHLARAYLGQGKVHLAQTQLDAAINLNPAYEDAQLLRAEVHLRSGDPGTAVLLMNGFLEAHPDSTRAKMSLAGAYAAAGQFDEALAIYRERLHADPSDFQSHFMTGLILRQQGLATEARESFRMAGESDPGNLAVTARLVEMDLADDDSAAARKRVNRLLAADPDAAPVHFLLATIHASRKEWPEAEAALKKCLELDGNHSRAYDTLISVYLETGRLEEARRELDAVIAKDPGNITALLLAATVQQQQGDFAAARAGYEAALALDPNIAMAQNNLAFLYLDQFDKLEDAYELATKARAADSEDPSIADTLGWIALHRGEFRKALALLEESGAKADEHAEIQYHLGRARYMMGRRAEARAAFEKALAGKEIFAGKDQAQALLQILDQLDADPAPSTADLDQLAEAHPEDVVVQLSLAKRYHEEGDAGKSAAACQRALAVNPDLLEAHTLLAELHAGELTDPGQALVHAKKARALAPGDPAIAAALGRIALRSGNVDWAYTLLLESNQRLPGNDHVLFNLAQASYRLGRPDEAEEHMQLALGAAPDGPFADDAGLFLRLLALSLRRADPVTGEAQVKRGLENERVELPAAMASAALQADRGDTTGATETYHDILNRVPSFPLAQIELAKLLMRAGDSAGLGRAGELLRDARKAIPSGPLVTVPLAELSYRQKDYAHAIRLLEGVGPKTDLPSEALAILGLSQVASNTGADGNASLQLALDRGLTGALLEPVRQALGN